MRLFDLLPSLVLKFIYSDKILPNLYRRFVLCNAIQIYGGDFANFCGLLKIYELHKSPKFTQLIKAWGFIRLSPIYFLTYFYSAICKSLVPDSRSNLHISLKSLNKRDAFKDTKSSFRVPSFPIPIPFKSTSFMKGPLHCLSCCV